MTSHSYTHKIYFADTDQAAVVHHSNYLRYFEAARIQFLSDIGFPYKKMQEDKIGLAPVDISIQYLSPLRLEDEYEIKTTLVAIKKATLILDQKAYCTDTLCCSATIKLASLDENIFKIVPINPVLSKAIKHYFETY